MAVQKFTPHRKFDGKNSIRVYQLSRVCVCDGRAIKPKKKKQQMFTSENLHTHIWLH